MVKLSIIIPVYNVEKYIRKCILSCINQDVQHDCYEIIVINDGTPDNSMSIVDELSNKYDIIKVYNQENQGLSVARNHGLNNAIGKYVWFVDSDDSIIDNCLKGIVDILDLEPDVLEISYQKVYENGTSPIEVKQKKTEGFVEGKELLLKGDYPTPAQFSIYNREFLLRHNLSFYPHIYHEDIEFKPRVYYYAKKVMTYEKMVYNYLQRSSGSITSAYKLKNGLDSIKVCASLYSFGSQLEDKMQTAFAERIAEIINSNMYRLHYLNKEDRVSLLDEWGKSRYLFKYMLKSHSLISRIEGYIFLINLRLGAFVFRLPFLIKVSR